MLEIFDNLCILFAKAEQKHNQLAKRVLREKNLTITPVQMLVLYTLYKKDNVTLSELGKLSYLDNSTLTRVVGSLENLNLISRVASNKDRRAYLINLTDAGLALKSVIADIAVITQREMLSNCTSDEIKIFRDVLTKIFDTL